MRITAKISSVSFIGEDENDPNIKTFKTDICGSHEDIRDLMLRLMRLIPSEIKEKVIIELIEEEIQRAKHQ